MNIPPMLLSALSSKSSNPLYQKHMKFFSQHQSLAIKILHILQKKKYPPDFKTNLFKWFGALPLVQKSKICSTNAPWLLEILHQMIISNQFRSISIKINEYFDLNRYLSHAFIANISNDELKETDTPHYTDYYSLESNGPFALSYKTMSDKDKLEMLFMKNIRFLSVKKNGNENNCEDYNNVITLSNELLNDFNTFQKIFNELSDGNCFKNYPSVGTSKMKEENKTLYNFSLTKWLIQKPWFSLCELIVAQFELHIVVNYIYNLTYRTICDFDFFEGIEVIFNSNRDLVKYLQGIEKKVELFEKINFNAIVEFISKNGKIQNLIKKRKDDEKWVYSQSFERRREEQEKTIEEEVSEAKRELNELYNTNLENFVEAITFIADEKVNTVWDFTCKKIYEQIIDIKDKIVENELFDILNETKKKKRKHKKKKDKEEEEVTKEEENENKINTITLQKEELSEQSTNIDTDTEDQKPKNSNSKPEKKKKKKGFFLYNTVTTKKAKKVETITTIQTNKLPSSISVTNTGTFQFIIQQPQIQIPSILDTFHTNLFSFTNEISNFVFEIEKTKTILFVQKENILHQIKLIITSSLQQTKFNTLYQIDRYGSSMTGLSIENSDIDIMIKTKPKTLNSIINLVLDKIQKNQKLFTKITPILTASVPVIKLESDIEPSVNPEMKSMLVSKSLTDIFTAKFDISFIGVNNIKEKLPSQSIIDYIKDKISKCPNIKPLIYLMKKFLFFNKLNSSYHGGLSSYSVFLMIYSYIKTMQNQNIGSEVYLLFCFYANFDYANVAIDVNQTNPFVMRNDLDESANHKIVIYDPLTGLNVAKSSYRVDEIKAAFTKAANCLYKALYSNNKKSILSEFFNLN